MKRIAVVVAVLFSAVPLAMTQLPLPTPPPSTSTSTSSSAVSKSLTLPSTLPSRFTAAA